MDDITKKNYESTKCKNCGHNVDISMTTAVRRLVAQVVTLKESLTSAIKSRQQIHRTKNGQIQIVHKMVAQLYQLLPEEKKKEAYELNKVMRDEIKRNKKRYDI